MKQLILSAACALFSVAAIAQGTKAIPIGTNLPAKDVKMQATDGKWYTLNEVKNTNGLLVMFSCNTCPYVIKSQQRTMQIMKITGILDIPMIILNSNEAQRGQQDSKEAMAEYAKTQQYFGGPYVVDENSKVANAFGATRTPEVFLFNGKGKLVYTGAMEDNPSDPESSKEMYLANAMQNMKDGKAINPATTKSIGCSIKRAN